RRWTVAPSGSLTTRSGRVARGARLGHAAPRRPRTNPAPREREEGGGQTALSPNEPSPAKASVGWRANRAVPERTQRPASHATRAGRRAERTQWQDGGLIRRAPGDLGGRQTNPMGLWAIYAPRFGATSPAPNEPTGKMGVLCFRGTRPHV